MMVSMERTCEEVQQLTGSARGVPSLTSILSFPAKQEKEGEGVSPRFNFSPKGAEHPSQQCAAAAH